MKDWHGTIYHSVDDPMARNAIAEINDFLFQLSPSIARLAKGQTPDSSGGSIPFLDDFFYLPGRVGNQVGHGGTTAGGSLTLASTKHSTKGNIYFGNALASVYDEDGNRFGIGIAAPEANKLHVYGETPEATVWAYPTGVYTLGAVVTGVQWGSSVYGTPINPPAPTGTDTLWYQQLDSDDNSDYIEISGVTGTYGNVWFTTEVLDGAVPSWTVRVGIKFSEGPNGRGPGAAPGAGGHSILVQMVNEDEVIWNWTIPDSTITSGFTEKEIAFVLSGGNGTTTLNPAAGPGGFPPANSVRFSAFIVGGGLHNGIPAGSSIQIGYIKVAPTSTVTAAVSAPLSIFELSTAADGTHLTEWRDETSTVIASVSSEGLGQFQNVALEDPGAGTNTITHKAPTAPTTHSLVWPTVPVDTGLLQVSYSAPTGTLSWIPASSLSTRVQHRWMANGPFKTDTDVDGAYIAPHAVTVTKTILHRRLAGSSGTTSVVLYKNGVSQDTRSVNSGMGNNATDTSGTLSIAVAAGDRLTIDCTSAEAGTPADFALILEAA